MRVEASSSFATPIYLIVLLLAFGCTFVVNAQAPAEDHSPFAVGRQIVEMCREGKFKEAIPLAEQLVVLTKQARGPDEVEVAGSIDILAFLYQRTGAYPKAEPLFTEALEIRQKVLGRKHPDTATSLNNLASLYQAMGDYAKAEPLFTEALEIRRKVLGREHPDTAQSLNNLALLYQVMGDYAKAESLLKEALAIRQKVLGPQHLDTAISLNNLAELYQVTGDYTKAEPLLKEAIGIYQKVLGPQHPDTAKILDNLAYVELDLGEIQEAKQLGQLRHAAGVKAFFQILSFGSEDQRIAYQHLLDPYTLFVALGESDPSLADEVLHYKGVVLDSIIEDRLLAESSKVGGNRDLVEQLNAKKRLVAQLSLQMTPSSPNEASDRLRALEREVEDIESKLGRQITDLGQARRALSITVDQMQAALPSDTVLVDYVRYLHYLGKSKFELRYGAVVLSADAPPRWVSLGSAKQIEATLKRYQTLVRHPGDEDELTQGRP
jgi:tetratricopeptide (TPR) repeat protein